MRNLIDKLKAEKTLSRDEFKSLLLSKDQYLFESAKEVATGIYGNDIFIRGLIEFSNFCSQNCLYCGLRRDNKNIDRYRLTKEQILQCCKNGYNLGFRTFVLQSGEDPFFTDEILCDIVAEIRAEYSDCAITLSVGEREFESYKRLFKAGANRFLLRHEAASEKLYDSLHPKTMSLENRKDCLFNLKKIGYQVGCGFMVGAPSQTLDDIVDDLLFIHKLQPQMVGIGPFIPHKDTTFNSQKAGSADLTINILAILRLMIPNLLLPATTALATLDPRGREKAILAGANVVMPNLSPIDVRKKYMIYDNKICVDDEITTCIGCISRRVASVGYKIAKNDRGDFRV